MIKLVVYHSNFIQVKIDELMLKHTKTTLDISLKDSNGVIFGK